MKKFFAVSAMVGLLVAITAAVWSAARAADAPAGGDKIFELRTYVTNPGKLEALHKRFREHTCGLFKKHGIELVGFWTPAEGPEAENTLIYLVAFPNKEAQKKAWNDFKNDPDWQKAFKESHKDGIIVDKVMSKSLISTDYSPIR
jgi:hypothetical protein